MLEAIGMVGRLQIDFTYVRVNDANPGTGMPAASSRGMMQARLDLGAGTFASARYEGISNTLGTFGRTGVIGAGRRINRSLRVTVEDAIRHDAVGTHNTLHAVATFGFARTHVSEGAY